MYIPMANLTFHGIFRITERGLMPKLVLLVADYSIHFSQLFKEERNTLMAAKGAYIFRVQKFPNGSVYGKAAAAIHKHSTKLTYFTITRGRMAKRQERW